MISDGGKKASSRCDREWSTDTMLHQQEGNCELEKLKKETEEKNGY